MHVTEFAFFFSPIYFVSLVFFLFLLLLLFPFFLSFLLFLLFFFLPFLFLQLPGWLSSSSQVKSSRSASIDRQIERTGIDSMVLDFFYLGVC
ncbi:hypothetical protein QBC32DRAFT_346693 [Pseudoneurospora amorphoporcata]|uniref:Uncharacterized protein n=1 Tax=Pseudoneurospora amorphoporcata TaxID=241081 RepID=A0AAN6NSS0_9PEZI|nr:hypothetical protein QBC32DRAFT_346693 [Pseudoneurospora amorphoporcata]